MPRVLEANPHLWAVILSRYPDPEKRAFKSAPANPGRWRRDYQGISLPPCLLQTMMRHGKRLICRTLGRSVPDGCNLATDEL